MKTHILYSETFFFENRTVYEVMWRIKLGLDSPQITRNTAHALCMLGTQANKLTLTICNTYFFLLQQWLRERASQLRYTCTGCLVQCC
jgi:hypothetical protein